MAEEVGFEPTQPKATDLQSVPALQLWRSPVLACWIHLPQLCGSPSMWRLKLAEGVRFELTGPFGPQVFKTSAINRSATLPRKIVTVLSESCSWAK